MQSFENEPAEGSISRRKFLKRAGAGLMAAPFCSFGIPIKEGGAQEGNLSSETIGRYEGGWDFTSEEIKAIYEREYKGAPPLKKPVRYENGELVAPIFDSDTRKEIEVIIPPQFVERMLKHFDEMYAADALQYLFRLDSFHSHPFVDKSHHAREYAPLSDKRRVQKALADPKLKTLYHNYEHLKIPQPGDPMYEQYKKRNVTGYFNGNPITILPLPEGKNMTQPISGSGVPFIIIYAAHRDGVITYRRGEEVIKLDLSLHIDDATYF